MSEDYNNFIECFLETFSKALKEDPDIQKWLKSEIKKKSLESNINGLKKSK